MFCARVTHLQPGGFRDRPDDRAMSEINWAKQNAERIREIGRASGLDQRAHTPKMWLEARQALRRRLDSINQALGEDVLQWVGTDANAVVIRIQDESDEILCVNYRPDILEIRCEYTKSSQVFRPQVTPGRVTVFCEKAGAGMSPDALVEHILDHFIGSL
jgi:hypothetical protein